MRKHHSAVAAVIAALLALAACEFAVKNPSFPEISFSHLPQIRLDVAQIEVINEYQAPAKPPNVDHLFPTPPSAVAERWGRDRLQAVGATGKARVIVRRASVVEVPLKTQTGIRGALTTDQSERYDADVEMTVEIVTDQGTASVTSRSRRSRTVPEDITLNDREKEWFQITEALMNDLNASLEAEMRKGMAKYIR